jgi:hypothetical protein
LDHCYAIKEEKVYFDLTGINENVKIAITPLTKYLINLLARTNQKSDRQDRENGCSHDSINSDSGRRWSK